MEVDYLEGKIDVWIENNIKLKIGDKNGKKIN